MTVEKIKGRINPEIIFFIRFPDSTGTNVQRRY